MIPNRNNNSINLKDLQKKLKWDVSSFPVLRKDSDWPMYRVHLWLAAAAAGLDIYVTPPSMTGAYDPSIIPCDNLYKINKEKHEI